MAEFFLWAAAAGVGAITYYGAKKSGMFDEVPREPEARLTHFNSEVIGLLKRELVGAPLESVTAQRVEYRSGERTNAIWFEAGQIHCTCDSATPPYPLGALGQAHFSLEKDQLSILLVSCEQEGLEHRSELTLGVRPL